MTEPPDQLSERVQSPESVRPRESDRVHAELQERMERLPPGHPSSPYNDDGSRRPPEPDQSGREYPIPGDPDYQPATLAASEADHPTAGSSQGVDHPGQEVDKGATVGELTTDNGADDSVAGEDTPREGSDGSWEWKGYLLSPR